MDRQAVIAEIGRRKLSAIIRTDAEETAQRAMRAAVDGGFRVVEFTLTTPGALRLVREFAADERLLVGAGTVLTVEAARESVEAGARFLVSPVFDVAVVREAAALGVGSVPGTFTPTEMLTAHRAGADILKLFPSPGAGPDYVRAIRGPLPELRIFPTAGVTRANFLDFLHAGAFGVGFVASLFDADDLRRGAFDAIRARAAEIIAALNASPFAPAR